MENKKSLVFEILKTFHDTGLLNELILIGSWCQIFYKQILSEELPALRTQDIDFLIPKPNSIKISIDIPKLLEKHGFREVINNHNGLAKYSHPDLELEFLAPKKGRGTDKPVMIKKLNINAVKLRYLNLLQSFPIDVEYKDIKLKIPEPGAYVLHKFIISQRRLKNSKRKKDLDSAINIGKILIADDYQKKRIIEIYDSFPIGWKKTLNKILRDKHIELYNLLCENR